jgi:hypothetical protein
MKGNIENKNGSRFMKVLPMRSLSKRNIFKSNLKSWGSLKTDINDKVSTQAPANNSLILYSRFQFSSQRAMPFQSSHSTQHFARTCICYFFITLPHAECFPCGVARMSFLTAQCALKQYIQTFVNSSKAKDIEIFISSSLVHVLEAGHCCSCPCLRTVYNF